MQSNIIALNTAFPTDENVLYIIRPCHYQPFIQTLCGMMVTAKAIEYTILIGSQDEPVDGTVLITMVFPSSVEERNGTSYYS